MKSGRKTGAEDSAMVASEMRRFWIEYGRGYLFDDP